MKEQVKAILFDFKDAGWSVQKVEKELGFSNGSLGKSISDFRFCKLLELHKREIKKQPTATKELEDKIAENNLPENKRKIEKERNPVIQDLTKPNVLSEVKEQPTTNYTVNTKAKEGDPKEGTMAFFNKYGRMSYKEL